VVVLPALPAVFARRHPRISFEVNRSSSAEDLVKGGYDPAIRVTAGGLPDSSLMARRSLRTSGSFYAAPAYISRRGRPKELCDPLHTWVHHRALAQVLRMPPEEGRYRVDDFLLARELLAEGLGVGLLPTFLAQALQHEGRLEELSLPDVASLTGELVLLYPSSGQMPRKVAALRDFLIESSRGNPVGGGYPPVMFKLGALFFANGLLAGLLSFLVLVIGVGTAGPSISDGESAVVWIGAAQALIWLGSSVAHAACALAVEAPLWAKLGAGLLYLLLACCAFMMVGFSMLVMLNR
jgi:LysR substrate binding domain